MKLLSTTAAMTALLLALPVAAQVYKTTDENGKVIYSDRPSNKSEAVELRETNTAPAINTDRPEQASDKDATDMAMPYRVRITGPQSETHLPPGERNLTVSFEANQPLEAGLRFQLLSNGAPIGSSTTGNSITVPEIIRGEHQLTVIIYDQNDRILAESSPLTIYVHRTTAPKPQPRGG